jgi:CBS domain-containing protein
MKISEVLAHLEPREVPFAQEDDSIDDVIRVAVRFPHTRLVYVVDEERRFVGTITMGSLLRHIFPHHYEEKVHAHGVLRRITAETARSIMDKGDVFATPEETVDEVLERMAETRAKEMAVVDADRCVIGDVTAVDLLRYFYLKTQKRG